MDPQQPKRLLIGLTRVFECKDAKAANPSWSPISMVLSPASDVTSQYITALAIAPSNSKTIYAATAEGHVWTTTDNGQNWKQNDTGFFGTGAGKVIDMRIDPANAKRVFAVTNAGAGKNIWFLDPATGKWKSICGDMPKNLWMGCICADWKNPTVLFVGTARAVYRSTDLGVHWKVFGLYLPNTVTNDLQTIPASNILAAGTFGRGVWEILLAPPKEEIVKTEKVKPPKKGPAPKLKRAPVSDPYFHVSDMNMLPGRLPGQPLVNPEGRKKAKRK